MKCKAPPLEINDILKILGSEFEVLLDRKLVIDGGVGSSVDI